MGEVAARTTAGKAAEGIAVRCEQLVKSFGDFTAVDGISFEVKAGECFGLLGPNGAGKTTTLEMLEGLSQPTSGKLEIFGLSWGVREQRRELRGRMGATLQETRLPERLTVLETLRLFRSFFPRGPSVAELITRLSLQDKQNARVVSLSGGQRQRLGIACALAGSPDLLMLDEPTVGLDPQTRIRLWELIEDFTRNGGTTIVTTHYMDEAARLCSRIAIVDHGKLIALGSPSELIAKSGAHPRVWLTLAHDKLDAAALGALAAVTQVEPAAAGERGYRLVSRDLGATLAALMAAVQTADDRLVTLTTREPTLEDAFVALTGHALRDDVT
jgi:ABC-2 type transport system ATP-binding protein